MVGIAGGAPSAHHDVRLGDVVVGTRVVPYNEVKLTDEGRIFNGNIVISDKGPLQYARKVTGRIVDGLLDIDDRISQHFTHHKSERIRDMFERPGDQLDCLYEAHYRHTDRCDCMLKNPRAVDRLVVRPQRKTYDRIKVHFGKIGSAAILVKTAEERDIESQKHNLLCFEMESAGLVGMDKFFCLPIRGICDYADSHKNKHWQPYAAASAAIFAKSLLESLQPSVIMRLQPGLDPDGVHKYVQSVVNDVNRVTNERMDRLGLDYDKVDRSVQDLNAHVVWLLRMSTEYSGDLADLKSTNNHNADAIDNARGRLQEVEKDQKKMGEALQKMDNHIKDLHSTSISMEEKQKLEGLHRQVQSHASQLESLRATTHHSLSLATFILEKVGPNTQNRKVMIASDILGNHGSITDRDGYWGRLVSRERERRNNPSEGPSNAPSEPTTPGSLREEMQSKQHTSKLEELKSKVLRQKPSKKNEGRGPEREIQPRNYNHPSLLVKMQEAPAPSIGQTIALPPTL